jgi:hypothetical protein
MGLRSKRFALLLNPGHVLEAPGARLR